MQPMVAKLAYPAKLDTYRGEFDAAGEQARLNLPPQAKKLERPRHVVREREKTTRSCVLLSGYAIRHKIVWGGARPVEALRMKGNLMDLQNSFFTRPATPPVPARGGGSLPR
jgi:hypothetical protein